MTVVDDIKNRVESRLDELQPMVDEYRELLAIRASLNGSSAVSVDDALAPSRGRAAPTAGNGGRRSSRSRAPRAAGGRAAQAIEIIGAKPGITVKEIARTMGINDNYLYRLLPRMERDGQLKRHESGWAVS